MDKVVSDSPEAASTEDVSFGEAVSTFARIGVLSFGCPMAQSALMHKIIVEEKKWLDEEHYLNALSFCMLLPGPRSHAARDYVG